MTRKYTRKAHRMQPEMTGAVPAAPEPIPAQEPSGEAAFQSTVLTLLEQMQGGLAQLAARVDRVEGRHPQFARQTVEELSEVEDGETARRKTLDAVPLDGKPHASKIPVFSDGLEVHELVMAQYEPQFRDGQRVRLNLDVVPYGRDDGMTRRDLKLRDGTPDGVGEIINMQFLSKQQGKSWKYKVKFPNRVLPGSNGGTSSFYEWELLPA